MAVVLKSKSGKAVMFVDDRGFVYSTNAQILRGYLNGNDHEPLLLSLLPARVYGDRFGQSRLFVNGESMTLQEAFDKGFIDRSFWESVSFKDGLTKMGNKKDKQRAETKIGDIKL